MSKIKQVRYLAPEQLAEAAEEISKLAREENVTVALCGGYALQHYGSERLTGDLDFCADGILENLDQGSDLSFGGQQVFASNGVTVDLIVRSDEYHALYEDALEHATRLRGVKSMIVSAEHLLAMKMEAQRDKDFADMSFLLNSGVVNLTKARDIVREFLGSYAVKDLDNMAKHSEWAYPELKKNPPRGRRR